MVDLSSIANAYNSFQQSQHSRSIERQRVKNEMIANIIQSQRDFSIEQERLRTQRAIVEKEAQLKMDMVKAQTDAQIKLAQMQSERDLKMQESIERIRGKELELANKQVEYMREHNQQQLKLERELKIADQTTQRLNILSNVFINYMNRRSQNE